jgi:hypothetical protein
MGGSVSKRAPAARVHRRVSVYPYHYPGPGWAMLITPIPLSD